MDDKKARVKLPFVQTRLVELETLGFAVAIAACWVTEAFDPPFSFSQVLIDTAVLLVLGALVILFTRKLLGRISYLEGFIVICANCKRIKEEETWVPVEKILLETSALDLSHGICPDCMEKLYGDFMEKPKA